MAQYIDKSAVMAEIERRLEALANTSAGDNREFAAIIGAQHYELLNLGQYINTLEYKDGEIVESQKPKFNIGDWISGYYTNYKVTAINSKGYVVEDTDGNKINILFENEKFHHLFTIADAKDGDVLVASDGSIFIYAGSTDIYAKFYVALTKCGTLNLEGGNWEDKNSVHPATKKQRDLLFQKMKEAGYDWDADKKELKKVENTRPMLSDFFNAEHERGKTSFANRQLYNRAILKILSDYVEKYPDTRFGQMLYNLGISSAAENNFYVESSKTYQGINARLKEQENGKNRVI